jgi:hypothetical protein
MWNIKAKEIPITRANVTISELSKKYLGNIKGKHKIKDRQQPYLARHTYFGKY